MMNKNMAKYDFSNESAIKFRDYIKKKKESIYETILDFEGKMGEEEMNEHKSSYLKICEEEKNYNKKRNSYIKHFTRYVNLKENLSQKILQKPVGHNEISELQTAIEKEEKSLMDKYPVSFEKDTHNPNKLKILSEYLNKFNHN